MDNLTPFDYAIARILKERTAQIWKWGGDTHDDKHNDVEWAAILSIRVGKLHAAMIDDCDPVSYMQRLVEVAAVAVAAIESLSKKEEFQP